MKPRRDTIKGSARLHQKDFDDIVLPTLNLGLRETTIDQNGFEGVVTLKRTPFGTGTTFQNGRYEGGFYRANVPDIGGTISGVIKDEDGKTLLQGGFIGAR